jgi:nicotinamide riboside kinase
MKKIACIGTHSVGKSTLCYQLAESGKRAGENVHVIQERVRFSPFPINKDMVYETAIWACTNQISKELEAQQKGFSLIICDRSALDPFFYAEHFKLNHPHKVQFELMAIEWLKTYDEIYFVRPGKDHRAAFDGTRSTDLEFVMAIDFLFSGFLWCRSVQFPVKTVYTEEIFS